MEKLYGAAELAERWHCNERTARERMRKIGGFGRPMLCREGAIITWERQQEEAAVPQPRQRKRRNVTPITQGPLKPGQIISRVRPKTGT